MARINIPPVTRTLLVLLYGLTILNSLLIPSSPLSFFIRIGQGSPLLSLIPGESFLYPWTLLTASLVEQNIFGLLVNTLTLYFGGRYLERAWGLPEFAKFIALICVVPNVLCFLVYLAWYGASDSPGALYVCSASADSCSSDRSPRHTTISGGIALQSAFLVAFKQLVPEHTVSVLQGMLRMRVKHFPAVFLLANTVAGLVLGTDTAMFLSWFAFLTSWTYLRFYRLSPLMTTASTGGDVPTVRGDASDTFAFAYFFPEPLHAPVAAVADRVYELLVAVRVCTPFSAEDVDVGNEQASARAEGGGALPLTAAAAARGSGRREEAERRRALALKALDQRLHAATAKPPGGAAIMTIPAPQLAPEGDDAGESSKPS
jgi:membrane associated rhomboid family serine protease